MKGKESNNYRKKTELTVKQKQKKIGEYIGKP